MRYFYLHGFASSPKSRKAQHLSDRLAEHGLTLEIPDFNQPDFSTLTLTRQLDQMVDLLGSDRAVLLGSSFGGLTASYLGDRLGDQIAELILLAPAFGFPQRWRDRLSLEQRQTWETTGQLMVHHYGEGKQQPLNYSFWEDAQQYDWTQLTNTIPTQIFHGLPDDTVPVEHSRQYAANRDWVTLTELDSDHGLGDRNTLQQITNALLDTLPAKHKSPSP